MSIRPLAAAILAGLMLATPVAAQGTAPNPPAPGRDSADSAATLSEKLGETGGVIRPPANIDPEITTKPPVPNPGTTTVIPPGAVPQQPAR